MMRVEVLSQKINVMAKKILDLATRTRRPGLGGKKAPSDFVGHDRLDKITYLSYRLLHTTPLPSSLSLPPSSIAVPLLHAVPRIV